MLQIKNLQVGNGRSSGIYFVSSIDHFARKIVGPPVLVVFHLGKCRAEFALRGHRFPLP